MAIAATSIAPPRSGVLVRPQEDQPAQVFQKGVLRSGATQLELPSPEQESFHKESLKKSLVARYIKATHVISKISPKNDAEISQLDHTSLLRTLAERLGEQQIPPADDPEDEARRVPKSIVNLNSQRCKKLYALVAALIDICREEQDKKASPLQQLEAVTLLVMRFVDSVCCSCGMVELAAEESQFFIMVFSAPPFRELIERDWHVHRFLCEMLFDIHNYSAKYINEHHLTSDYKKLSQELVKFEKLVPLGKRSQKCRGEHYLRLSTLYSCLERHHEAFLAIDNAEQAGITRAAFDKAMIHLGQRSITKQFACLDYAIKNLQLLQRIHRPEKEDDPINSKFEENLLEFAKSVKQVEGHYRGTVENSLFNVALRRYMGIECRDDKEIFQEIIRQCRHLLPQECLKLKCLIRLISEPHIQLPPTDKLSPFESFWFQGKNYEKEGKLGKALELFTKAADIDAFQAGWAPVRVAIQQKQWEIAFQYGQKFLKAWPDGFDESEKELLTDAIAEASGLYQEQLRISQASIDEQLAWIEGSESKTQAVSLETSTKKKQRKKRKQGGPSTSLPLAPHPRGSKAKAGTEVSVSKSHFGQAEKKSRNIKTFPISEEDRLCYRANRQLFRMAITDKNFELAQQIVDDLPNTDNPIYQARKAQYRCWLLLRLASTPSYILEQVKAASAVQHKEMKIEQRIAVESIAVDALGSLLELSEEEKKLLFDEPEKVLSGIKLSNEVRCVAASLLSTLGHYCQDHHRDFPWLEHLEKLKKQFYDWADKINPWRLDIKAGRDLSNEALAAMNF